MLLCPARLNALCVAASRFSSSNSSCAATRGGFDCKNKSWHVAIRCFERSLRSDKCFTSRAREWKSTVQIGQIEISGTNERKSLLARCFAYRWLDNRLRSAKIRPHWSHEKELPMQRGLLPATAGKKESSSEKAKYELTKHRHSAGKLRA